MLPVVILAGGLATRLRPMTEKIPKALVEINGRPFIEHQLELLARNGISRVVLSVAYLGEMIAEHVGDGGRFGVSVSTPSTGTVTWGRPERSGGRCRCLVRSSSRYMATRI